MQLTFDASPDDFKIFIEEADEQIGILDSGFLELEREASPDLLSAIFRAAHTLKGSSATIGHTRMAQLTHALEGVLDLLRKGDVCVSTALIDGLLQGLDALRLLREEIDTGETGDLELEPVIAKIRSLEMSAPAAEAQAKTGSGSADRVHVLHDDGGTTVLVEIVLAADCAFPAVRAFQAVNELQQLGDVHWTKPSEAEIAAEDVERSVSVLMSTIEDGDQLAGAVKAIIDVVDVTISPYQTEHAAIAEPEIETPMAVEPVAVATVAPGKPIEEKVKPQAPKPAKASKTIRFDVGRLDSLMNLMGEMVVERSRLAQIAATIGERYGEGPQLRELHEATLRMGRVIDELQNQTMKARMLPIEQVFSRFPRMVRDLAQRSGKEVDFIIDGQETELDRSIIEEIGDPLIHLLRNAVDHAIEPPDIRVGAGKSTTGRIRLSAFHSENQIVLEVEDDGKGIDVERLKSKAVERGALTREAADRLTRKEAVNLVFDAGLSTAEKVTDVSGRGVGMDIVRANIEKLNGSIAIETQQGTGTKFTVRVPLTLAIMPVLLVKVESDTCAVPLASVVETLRVSSRDIHTIRGHETVRLRDDIVPLLRLRSLFGRPADTNETHTFIVAVRSNDRLVGLVVDSFLRDENIVIKPLGPVVGSVPGISGATILGDGTVGLIVDVPSLVQRSITLRNQAA